MRHSSVVDDDAARSAVLHDVLTGEGFQVRLADDGQTVPEPFKQAGGWVILLDWMPPPVERGEVFRHFHTDPDEWDATRVILLTASLGFSDEHLVLMAEVAAALVAQPFEFEEGWALVRGAGGVSAKYGSIHPVSARGVKPAAHSPCCDPLNNACAGRTGQACVRGLSATDQCMTGRPGPIARRRPAQASENECVASRRSHAHVSVVGTRRHDTARVCWNWWEAATGASACSDWDGASAERVWATNEREASSALLAAPDPDVVPGSRIVRQHGQGR